MSLHDDIFSILGYRNNEAMCPKKFIETVGQQFITYGARNWELLACGGEAVILKYTQLVGEKKMVLKVANPRLTYTPSYNFKKPGEDFPITQKRFIRGCKIQKALYEMLKTRFSNFFQVPQVDKIFEETPSLACTMEFVEGINLMRHVAEVKNFRFSLFLFRSLLQCVEYIHNSGFLHRDIKPENILITSNLKSPSLCFLDWTQSRPLVSSLSVANTMIGTLLYASDKATIDGNAKNFTEEDDVHCLGVMLWEFINFARLPETQREKFLNDKKFKREYYEKLQPGIPASLAKIFRQAIGLEEPRFQNVGPFLFEIEKLLLNENFFAGTEIFSLNAEQIKGFVFDLAGEMKKNEERLTRIEKLLKEFAEIWKEKKSFSS